MSQLEKDIDLIVKYYTTKDKQKGLELAIKNLIRKEKNDKSIK